MTAKVKLSRRRHDIYHDDTQYITPTSIMTLSTTSVSIITLSIMTFSIMTLSIMTLNTMPFSDTQLNIKSTQHFSVMLVDFYAVSTSFGISTLSLMTFRITTRCMMALL